MASLIVNPSTRERAKATVFLEGWVLAFLLASCRASARRKQACWPAPPSEGRRKKDQPAGPIPHQPSVNTTSAPRTGLRR